MTYRICVVFGLVAASHLTACGEATGVEEAGYVTTSSAIVNGTRSPTVTNLSAGEQLAIGYLATDNTGPFCTATLIDRDVAITAEHCINGTYPVDQMRFGMGDPDNPDAYISVHSAPMHSTRDVALVFLQQDAVSLVPNAEPLAINRSTPSYTLIGTSLEAAGYGETMSDSDGQFFVTVELTDIQEEWLVVNGWGQQGICFGDSGGPLLAHVDNGEPVIMGVESHGDTSCVDQDFETRIDQALTWIDGEMGQFDPESPPETGTQGDGEICIPWGGFGEAGIRPGYQELKCGPGEIALCSTSPTQPVGLWWAPLFAMAFAFRRGRRIH